jgi:hypothetical protein
MVEENRPDREAGSWHCSSVLPSEAAVILPPPTVRIEEPKSRHIERKLLSLVCPFDGPSAMRSDLVRRVTGGNRALSPPVSPCRSSVGWPTSCRLVVIAFHVYRWMPWTLADIATKLIARYVEKYSQPSVSSQSENDMHPSHRRFALRRDRWMQRARAARLDTHPEKVRDCVLAARLNNRQFVQLLHGRSPVRVGAAGKVLTDLA